MRIVSDPWFRPSSISWAVLGRFIGGGANVVTAQYLRRVVPGRVSLAAEYQAQLGAGSQVKQHAQAGSGWKSLRVAPGVLVIRA